MGEPKLPMKGDDCPITFFIGTTRQQISDQCLSFEVTPRVKDHEHKYMGRKRDKFDQQLRGYDFKLTFDHADNSLFVAWQNQMRKREQNEVLDEISIGIDFEQTDGTVDTFLLHQGLVFKPSISGKGSDETGEVSVEGMCEEYDKAV